MAKSRGSRRQRVNMPVAVILGFMPLVATGINDFRAGGFQGLRNTVAAIVPYNPNTNKVDFSRLHLGLWPIIAGFIVHKIVGGMFGINRQIARMGIPWVRI